MREIFRGTFEATPAGNDRAREDLEYHLKRAIPSHPTWVMDITIAVGEVLQNIVRHEFGGPSIGQGYALSVSESGGDLFIDILDNAPPLTSTAFLEAEHEAGINGGMGLGIVREVMDAYSIEVLPSGNLHRLAARPVSPSGSP